ncbi:MAG TPA: inositol monophosphatase family protein [Jiangellaceae bacterium]
MLQTDAELAVRAAHAGAGVVRALYGGPLERFAKSAHDFATEADVASERAIMAVLREARPQDGFVGEELGAAGNANSDRSWLVDPLCGTLNYAARTPLVAVNVALRVGVGVGGGVAAAASADPFSAEVFWTDGRAAYVRSGGHDRPLAPDPANRLVDVNLDPPFPNRDRFRAGRLLEDEAFTDSFRPRVMSTTLALAWVAAGRRAAYVTDGRLRDSVHFSSGIALCQAAGCVVTNLAGEPLHSGAQGLVAAADATTHAELIGIVARHGVGL